MRLAFPLLSALAVACVTSLALAQPFSAAQRQPNLHGKLEQALRYTPDQGDFVIRNGSEFFNRPLYGGNTAFRVDAGDKPEFALYLPGRGGNVRIGVRSADGAAKWFNDATEVITRYRPGSMLYEIRDPLLGPDGRVHMVVIALASSEGVIVKLEGAQLPSDLELIFAYGGANGKRGKRDGDIGTEAVPISEYFQLKPEHCAGQQFSVHGSNFMLTTPSATLSGVTPSGTQLHVGDARAWNDARALLTSRAVENASVVVGRVAFRSATPHFLLIQRATPAAAMELADYLALTDHSKTTAAIPVPTGLPSLARPEDLPNLFAEAESHFAALRAQVRVETPDAFLDAAVGALNVAADAIWDEPQGAVMHGAIAWRSKLLGWRGPYAMDALGWHTRARRHLSYWATQQNTSPIPDALPPPEEATNLARSRTALHSNGAISHSHYDMNLVYIDALFRHLLWTGDLTFAREVWPVIERHLAWERRLFRREFTKDGETLPLYEAYAAIWASDDLQYHGGGVTHASAYNYYHNLMAARVAALIGEDAAPYQHEADLIRRGMNEHLWLEDRGTFAEFKDSLGLQLVHPSPGLWSIYHSVDSLATTAAQANRMVDYVKQNLPMLPVHGPGVPTDANLHVFSSTNWMPYEWSVNNVVMGENLHTALAFWQAGRPQEAWELTKGSLLAAMFMGICPGNVGSLSYLDVYRRESQRDFADGSGVTSRTIIEGLFGVRPDLLACTVTLAPGFPVEWDHAKIAHPDFDFSFRRGGSTDRYVWESRFPNAPEITVSLLARTDQAHVRVGGKIVEAQITQDGQTSPQLRFSLSAAQRHEIEVQWSGRNIPRSHVAPVREKEAPRAATHLPTLTPASNARFTPVDLSGAFNDRVTQIFQNEYRSPRSKGVSMAIPKQGLGGWAGSYAATAEIDDRGLRHVAAAHNGKLRLPNGVVFATPVDEASRNVIFTSQWDNYPAERSIALQGRARSVHLLMAGSTNWMQSRIDNGEVVVTYTDGTSSRLALRNPETWWPIDQDFFIDDYQFRHEAPVPTRVALQTGEVYVSPGRGAKIPGGAATVLSLALDPMKELQSLTVRTLANEVVIGLMAATLEQ